MPTEPKPSLSSRENDNNNHVSSLSSKTNSNKNRTQRFPNDDAFSNLSENDTIAAGFQMAEFKSKRTLSSDDSPGNKKINQCSHQ